jgi:hypothetical protein
MRGLVDSLSKLPRAGATSWPLNRLRQHPSTLESVDLVISFPTDEEGRSRRFTVHRNYLTSVRLFLETIYGTDTILPLGLLRAQRQLPAFRRINRRSLSSEREFRRLLAISWASELQLRLAAVGGDAFLRYSNAWAPVQAYYAVYMSVQAWLVTVGMSGLLDDHTRTLRSTVSHLLRRRLLPHPWDVSCEGSPELRERVIKGLPSNADPDAHIELLANPTLADFYPRFAKMLETTRDLRLKRLRKEWLRRTNRTRMLQAEKREMAAQLHPTTLFDYLWRLRIRANYGDVSAFLMSGVDDAAHTRFHEGLVTVAGATCLLVQSLVVAQVGTHAYSSAADEFTQGGGVDLGDPAAFLRERKALLTG